MLKKTASTRVLSVKARPFPAQEASPAPAVRTSPFFLRMLLGAVGLCLAVQLLLVVRLKVRQHLVVVPLAQALPQGDAPGQVSSPVSVQACPDGGVTTLSDLPGGWILQRFRPNLSLDVAQRFPRRSKDILGDLVGMAVLPDGETALDQREGRILLLDRGFAVARSFQFNTTSLGAMTAGPDGTFYALEPLDHRVVAFPREGLGSPWVFGADDLQNPRALALTASGDFVVLDDTGGRYKLRVFGPKLALLRSISVREVPTSPYVTIAPAGGDLVALNDSAWVGIVLYDAARGTFRGRAWGDSGADSVYPAFAFMNPGFVGGDARTGDMYVHFSPGLLKCRLRND